MHVCNKINQVCHPRQKAYMASGQGSHWLNEIPTIIHLRVTAHLRYVSNLFLNIFTMIGFTQYIATLFHSFCALCENEYFLI